jgi:hypothetical protein
VAESGSFFTVENGHLYDIEGYVLAATASGFQLAAFDSAAYLSSAGATPILVEISGSSLVLTDSRVSVWGYCTWDDTAEGALVVTGTASQINAHFCRRLCNNYSHDIACVYCAYAT